MSSKTTKGLMLRSIEGVLMQVISFVLQLVLARILLPEDFGVVAILSTFINLANTFVNNGLSSALLQKKEIKQTDICTVFYIEFGMSVLMYGIIYYIAPFIAIFYENPQITTYLRIFALSIVFGGASAIQLTISRHRMNFFPSLVSSIVGITVQAVLGIYLAINGGGLWSLIISQLSYHFIRAFLLIVLVHWKPTFDFSFQSFKGMFSYSWKLFTGWMIGTLYQDVFSWIIGKKFSSETLGYYTKGQSIPAIINKIATQVTTAVMFPSIAKNQDDMFLVKSQTRQMIAVSSAVIFPIMGGLAGVAHDFVSLVLTDKWLPAVPVIQILSISLSLNVINNANMQTYNAIGRSDMFMKFEIIKRSFSVVLVFVLASIDYYLMLWGIVLVAFISLIINAVYNRRLLGYSCREYAWDIFPYVLIGGLLFILIRMFCRIELNIYISFFAQLFVCTAFFFGFILSGILPGFKGIRDMLIGMRKR